MRLSSVLSLISALALMSQTASSAPLSNTAPPPNIIELQTNLGTITFDLDYTNAPISSNNFINYVKSGFYKNTLIHRTIKKFVVQGGGFSKIDGTQKATSAPIVNESNNGLSNLTGTVAMARTSDPNSATSQFYINLSDNTNLNYVSSSSPGYAVFGKVIDGMEVVRKIENLATYNQLPFTGSSGLVFIENAYSSYKLDPAVSKTRILLNGSGKVTSTPGGIDCGAHCYLTQAATGTIKLSATPATGYLFAGWRGDCQGSSANINIDLKKGNHNCTAIFSKSLTSPQ